MPVVALRPFLRTASGGPGPDRWDGTAESDSYNGGDGNDIVGGGGGDDRLAGNAGNDRVNGGDGRDELFGNDGNDTLDGGGGHDSLVGGAGSDVLYGGAGNDRLDLSQGNDRAEGGTGDDTYYGGTGGTSPSGGMVVEEAGGGFDTLKITDNGANRFEMVNNLEKLVLSGTGDTTVRGNAGDNVIVGNDGDNVLSGGDGADSLSGGVGSDWLDGGSGSDWMEGGSGNDRYELRDAGDMVFEDADDGRDTVLTWVDYRLTADVEDLILDTNNGRALKGWGNERNNVITGNHAANSLYGIDGNDTLVGDDGADYLAGGNGNDRLLASVSDGFMGNDDTLYGGDGNDSLEGDGGADSLYGGSGNDRIKASEGPSRLEGGSGDDTYVVFAESVVVEKAGEGRDTVIAGGSYTLGAELENLTVSGWGEVITAKGNDRSNVIRSDGGYVTTLLGMGGDDSLLGSADIDFLDGGEGRDRLEGGDGNDTYVLGAGDTYFDSGGTADTLRSSTDATLGGGLEILSLRGTGTKGLSGTGNASDNTIWGTVGNDTLNGAAGVDWLDGSDGDDIYIVDRSGPQQNISDYYEGTGDFVYENPGFGTDLVKASVSWTLGDNVENLTLTGSATLSGTGNGQSNQIKGNAGSNSLQGLEGNDTLIGDGGNDRLRGDSGADQLDGGSGNDILEGGTGADAFRFGAGRDQVTSFENDVDTLVFDDALWGGGTRSPGTILDEARIVNGAAVFDFENGNVLTVTGVTNLSLLENDITIS